MELWFSEFHAPDVKHSIRVNRHLYSHKSPYQQIDIYETPEFGKVLSLDGNVMLTERDEFIYDEKVYRCNEQKNESLDLAGDYCKTGGVQVNITGTENAAWAIKGKVAERSNGQCIIGLTPGKYTIEFTAVDGKTKPADQEVTVVEGEVTTATGAYT